MVSATVICTWSTYCRFQSGSKMPLVNLVQRLRAAVLADGRVQLVAVSLVGERLARRTDDRERRRQEPLQGEVVERGHQLAGGEVPGASEDHDGRRFGCARETQPFTQRVDDRRRHQSSFFTA